MTDITQVLQSKRRLCLASDEKYYTDRHLTITDEIISHNSERLNWFTTIALVIFHAGAIAALFFFTWKLFLITVALYWATTGLGISVGYHRLHTHRSFKTPIWLDYTFAICGALTLEGGPVSWVATHRIHHQKSDHDGIRTRPAMASGGLMSAGCSSAKRIT